MTTHNVTPSLKRRQFLKMASSAGIGKKMLMASPLTAGLLYNRFAEAAEDAKRAFLIYYPGGAPNGSWLPTDINTMNQASEPYAPVSQYCNFHNVQMVGGGHGNADGAMGGGANTIDTRLADTIGTDTPYSDFNLAFDLGSTRHDVMGRRGGQPKKPEEDADAAYKQLFGGPPPGGGAQALYQKQKNVIDANKAILDALQKKFGQHERERLETHIDALQKLDRRLSDASVFVPPEGCSDPELASRGQPTAGDNLKLLADIGIAAMRCGLTNVVTVQLSTSQCDWKYQGTFTENHHQTLHGKGYAEQVEVKKYLSGISAYIIQQLADTPDPTGGMMIDKTVFCETTDHGDGASHSASNSPWLVATNRPEFNTGRVIDEGTSTGVLNDMFTTLTS